MVKIRSVRIIMIAVTLVIAMACSAFADGPTNIERQEVRNYDTFDLVQKYASGQNSCVDKDAELESRLQRYWRISISSSSKSSKSNTEIKFSDPALTRAVKDALPKKSATITLEDAATITKLDAREYGIENLEGIQYLTNLKELYLGKNNIADISLLSKLTALEILSVEENKIDSISAVKNLKSLTYLDISKNEIENISAVSGLTNLTALIVNNNSITDITAVRRLQNLELLYIYTNSVSNISALSNLTKLEELDISYNVIKDISPLEKLTGLRYLYFSGNLIEDISPISELTILEQLYMNYNYITELDGMESMTALTHFSAWDNYISDISPLAELKKLSVVDLGRNAIHDISKLKKLTAVTELNLTMNQISDISVLASLKNLKTLYLYENAVVDLSPLKNLKKLKNFYLEDYYNSIKVSTALINNYKKLNDKVQEIVKNYIKPGMKDAEKVLMLHDYIATHVNYDTENYEKNTIPDVAHTAYGALMNGVAVCDGYSLALQRLLRAAGVECWLVVGTGFDMRGSEGHAWNIVKIDNKYYNIDATYNDGDFSFGHLYLNVSDKQLEIDHTWDKKRYPDCETDSKYFEYNLANEKYKQVTDEYVFVTTYDYELYRMDRKDGSIIKVTEDSVYEMSVEGEYIIFSNKSDGYKLYKMKLDGSEKTKLHDAVSYDIMTEAGKIYFVEDSDKGCFVKVTDLDGKNLKQLSTEFVVYDFDLIDGWLYYAGCDTSGKVRFYKQKSDGTNKVILGDNQFGSLVLEGYTIKHVWSKEEIIYNGWIYYFNVNDSNSLYRVKTDGSGNSKLCSESASYAIVYEDWVYFYSEKEKKFFRMKADGTEKVALQ